MVSNVQDLKWHFKYVINMVLSSFNCVVWPSGISVCRSEIVISSWTLALICDSKYVTSMVSSSFIYLGLTANITLNLFLLAISITATAFSIGTPSSARKSTVGFSLLESNVINSLSTLERGTSLLFT